MEEITLKQGGKTVTYKKDPGGFAVKLRRGRADGTESLAAACGSSVAAVRHVESEGTNRMDLFEVEDADTLESTMEELRASRESDIVTHVYKIHESDAPMIPTGKMTIQFAKDVELADREAVFEEFGLAVLEELDFIDRGYSVELTDRSTMNPLKIAAELQQRDEIETAEPDFSVRAMMQYAPDEPLYADQWHLRNRGDRVGLTEGADVNAEEAWDHTRGDRSITVCVIDDGFDVAHPDFGGPGKIVGARDFAELDVDPSPTGAADDHGTACAGVAIAEENDEGTVGLAPGCSFMPVRMPGRFNGDTIRFMFEHAVEEGADVVSCSWGVDAKFYALPTIMHAAIANAATQGRDGKGCVVLYAAGNEDRPLDGVDEEGDDCLNGFATHPNVVAVGASNSKDRRSWYSNFGPELTLCAPSSGAPGRGITTTDRLGSIGYSTGDYTNSFGGTSSATPLVAGLAALVLSVRPELTSAEVRQHLADTADEIDAENGEYDEQGHSDLYGAGRINAGRALAELVSLPQTLSMDHRVSKPIADESTTTDVLPFPLDVVPTAVAVSVDIQHTYRGDLEVTLEAPNGTTVLLHDREGRGENDLVRTYRSGDDPDLFSDVLGTSAEGDWTLSVTDHYEEDTGTLFAWGLEVTYDAN